MKNKDFNKALSKAREEIKKRILQPQYKDLSTADLQLMFLNLFEQFALKQTGK